MTSLKRGFRKPRAAFYEKFKDMKKMQDNWEE